MRSMRHVKYQILSAALVALLALSLCALPGPWGGTREAQAAPGAVPNPDNWMTDGPVTSVVSDGDTTYIGGSFNYVGPNTGFGVPLDASSGSPLATYPKVDGEVRAVVSDGSGGWYIGGEFYVVEGTAINRLAHILSDGTLDTAFDPDVNNTVYSMTLNGSTLYIGGTFTAIQGNSGGPYLRNRLAAIDTSTGNPAAFNPGANGTVITMALSGSTLYIGGGFTSIQGASGGPYGRGRIAAIDIATWNPTTWNPIASSAVSAIAISGSTVYAGGSFTGFSGASGGPYSRNYLAAIDMVTANPTSWNPNADSTVVALAMSGSTLYAGGNFAHIQGSSGGPYTRGCVAAFDVSSSNPTSWNPGMDGAVFSLGLYGSTLYAGGAFNNIQGSSGGPYTRNYFAAIDTSSGNPTSMIANANTYALAFAGYGSTLYVGGTFSSIGGVSRRCLAALDASTGMATGWDPKTNGLVQSLVLSGSTLYAGGQFTSIQGSSGGPYARNRIAAIDTATANPTAFNPGADSNVYALALSGTTLYAGGDFNFIQGASGGPYSRYFIAAIDTASGNPTTWNPNANGTVAALALTGTTLYTGGNFSTLQGASGGPYARSYLAAIDTVTGNPTTWNPNANGLVLSFAPSGSTLYVSGQFSSIQGSSGGPYARNRIAAIDTATANPTAFNPNADNNVYTLALSGTTLYAGGDFSTLQGASGGPYTRSYLAAIDTASGNPTSWNPGTNGSVLDFELSGSTLYVGGQFGIIGGTSCAGIAGFDGLPTVGSVTPATGENDGTVSITDLAGADYRAGAEVLLRKTGEADIPADNITVVSASRISCDFDLTGAAAGDWDVVVVNPDTQEGTLTAGFTVAQATRTITASAGANGTIDPSGAVQLDYGSDQAFTISPDAGWHVDDVLVDGSSVGAMTEYTFTNVTADHTISASFEQDAAPWYLAEGATAGGFETWVLVQNPGASAVTVDLTLMTESGPQNPAALQDVPISADSRVSFNIGEYVSTFNVSTVVTPDGGEVICERAMYGGERTWGTDSIGTTTPAATWYLAEGCTAGDFETWVLAMNPGASPVTVDLTFMTSAGPQAGPQDVAIGAHSRTSFNAGDWVTDYNVSTLVNSSDGDVVCERAMYGNARTWAHDSVGVIEPSPLWYLAEGATAGGFETWVLVQNPNATPVTVDLTLMTESGPQNPHALQDVEIGANSRQSFNLGDYVKTFNVSTMVASSGGDVICERAVYGGERTWGTDSIGAVSAAGNWYLAEGCTAGDFETWVLVQNPNPSPVSVDLTFMTSAGPQAGPQGVAIPAFSRLSFNAGQYVVDYNVSTEVTSSGGGVVCERAMYGNGRTWAHDSVGYAPGP